MFNAAVFCDFEFDTPETPLIGCFWHVPSDEKITIDFRQPDAVDRLRGLVQRWREAIWFSYSVRAELTCFLALGLDIDPMPWIDLMVESRQITGTHYHYHAKRASLLVTLEALGIQSRGSAAWKETMRNRILTTPRDAHTQAEWDELVDYCWSDIEPLHELWEAILQIHSKRKNAAQPIRSFQGKQSVYRAEYLKALAKLEYRSRGFPVDVVWLNRIFDNHRAVRRALAEDSNAHYGGHIFRHVKRTDSYSFHFKGLEAHIDSLPFPVQWELTPSGKRRRDSEYLDIFVKKNPHFKELQQTLTLLDQLKSGDLRKFEKNGYIKGGSIPYYTVTGRNQPMVRDGFVFNLPHWMRTIVRPHAGSVIVTADYSQQEIVVGASQSGDKMLAQALATGDVYCALGTMAGIIPPDGTKKTHPIERQSMKSVQLGIGYGMGVVKLGFRLFVDLQNQGVAITLDEATERAAAILKWHKRTFTAYWRYINEHVNNTREQGWTRARDGWTYFANLNSSYTKLQNFPMQANSACMLREAVKMLADIPEIELICTLHDSIVILAPEEDQEVHLNHLLRCMSYASQRVLETAPLPLSIAIEHHTYTHATGYHDDEGADMCAKIKRLLDDLGV